LALESGECQTTEAFVPTYQYACTECGHRLEAVQSFSDDALTVCPECEGRLRKLYSAVGIVFKGSGFYRTDSRSGSKSDATTPAPASANGSAAKSGSGTPDSSTTTAAKSDAGTSSTGSATTKSGDSAKKPASTSTG
jgi:putative FmdB family regulatory protein